MRATCCGVRAQATQGAHADRETQPRKLKQRQILTLHRTQTHTHTHKTQTRHLSFLLPPLAATTPKERVENVKRVHAPAHSLSVILDGILPVLVIHLPLLRVAEHLVGGGDLLELLNVPTLVRVVFYCCSLVRFLNLLSRTQVHERAHAHAPPPFISNSDARELACLVCWLARGAK